MREYTSLETMPVIHSTCPCGSQIWSTSLPEISLGISYYIWSRCIHLSFWSISDYIWKYWRIVVKVREKNYGKIITYNLVLFISHFDLDKYKGIHVILAMKRNELILGSYLQKQYSLLRGKYMMTISILWLWFLHFYYNLYVMIYILHI